MANPAAASRLVLDTSVLSHARSPSSTSTGTATSTGTNATTYFSSFSAPPLSPLSACNGDNTTLMRHARELPMPLVGATRSLEQARATLHLCLDKLKLQFGRLHETDPFSMEAITILAEMRRFRPWLEQWEKAFSAYLANAIPSMGHEELKRCRVIKANHLCSMILASTCGVRDVDFECFSSEFKAIVSLAGAVLENEPALDSPQTSPSTLRISSLTLSNSMNISDPLRVVVCCCRIPGIKGQAAEYLQQSMRPRSRPESVC